MVPNEALSRFWSLDNRRRARNETYEYRLQVSQTVRDRAGSRVQLIAASRGDSPDSGFWTDWRLEATNIKSRCHRLVDVGTYSKTRFDAVCTRVPFRSPN